MTGPLDGPQALRGHWAVYPSPDPLKLSKIQTRTISCIIFLFMYHNSLRFVISIYADL